MKKFEINDLMKAQVLVDTGKLNYREIPIPQIGPEEVLVKMKTAAICNGSDPNIFNGHIPEYLGHVFGHEPYGEVVACGSAVKGLKVGGHISWWFSIGAFAEYVSVNPSKVAISRIPDTIHHNEAPIMELVIASSRAVKAANIKPGSRLLILGLGPSGLIMSQLAKIRGASKVVGWDLYPMRREKSLGLGCDGSFDPALHSVEKLTKNVLEQVDVIIDAMGNDILPGEPTLDKAISLLARNGKVVSYGHPSRGRRFNPYKMQSRRATIIPPEQDIEEIRKLADECTSYLVEGKLNLKSIVSGVIPLSQVNDGLEMVMNHPDKYLKVIVTMSDAKEMGK